MTRIDTRGRRWLLGLVLALAGLALACASNAEFPDPSNPVTNTPWPDYELLRYDITDQREVKLGTVDLEVARVGETFEFRLLFLLENEQVRDEVVVIVDAETLRPLSYRRLAVDPEDRLEVVATYGVDAEGVPILESVVTQNGEAESETVTLGDFAFDTDSSAWLWRSIAFEQDFEVTYRSVNAVQQRSQLVRLTVVGQDSLSTPAGEFLAWQLEARPGLDRQNVWFEVDPPHRLVRWDLEPRRYRLREIVTERPDGS
jgi:hypothetical protein